MLEEEYQQALRDNNFQTALELLAQNPALINYGIRHPAPLTLIELLILDRRFEDIIYVYQTLRLLRPIDTNFTVRFLRFPVNWPVYQELVARGLFTINTIFWVPTGFGLIPRTLRDFCQDYFQDSQPQITAWLNENNALEHGAVLAHIKARLPQIPMPPSEWLSPPVSQSPSPPLSSSPLSSSPLSSSPLSSPPLPLPPGLQSPLGLQPPQRFQFPPLGGESSPPVRSPQGPEPNNLLSEPPMPRGVGLSRPSSAANSAPPSPISAGGARSLPVGVPAARLEQLLNKQTSQTDPSSVWGGVGVLFTPHLTSVPQGGARPRTDERPPILKEGAWPTFK